jgi:hypothetical protein
LRWRPSAGSPGDLDHAEVALAIGYDIDQAFETFNGD